MIENTVAIIVGSMPAFSHFIRRGLGDTILWKSVSSIFSTRRIEHTTHGSSSTSAKPGRLWHSSNSNKQAYGLRSQPASGEGFKLVDKSAAARTMHGNAGSQSHDPLSSSQGLQRQHQHRYLEGTGIVRTVDIFQHTQQRPGSTDRLV